MSINKYLCMLLNIVKSIVTESDRLFITKKWFLKTKIYLVTRVILLILIFISRGGTVSFKSERKRGICQKDNKLTKEQITAEDPQWDFKAARKSSTRRFASACPWIEMFTSWVKIDMFDFHWHHLKDHSV